jgi:hypothetical protein
MAQLEQPRQATTLLGNGKIFLKSRTPPYDGDEDRPHKGIVVEASSAPSPPLYQDLQHVIPGQFKSIPDEVAPSWKSGNLSLTTVQVIMAPYIYIKSLPGKGIRDILIDALNVWLQVPERQLGIIKKVVELLHTSSLMYAPILQSDGTTLSYP